MKRALEFETCEQPGLKKPHSENEPKNFPDDLWYIILLELGVLTTPLQAWLNFRFVSKSWNKCILRFEQVTIPFGFDSSRVLQLFNLKDFSICDNQTLDWSLLTKVTNLTLYGSGFRPSPAIQGVLQSLTQLNVLSLFYNPIIQASSLEPLTKPRQLTLNCDHITSLSPLTNLTTLNLVHPFSVPAKEIESLTKLTTLISNDPRIFRSGKGICLYNGHCLYQGGHIFPNEAKNVKNVCCWSGEIYEGEWKDGARNGKGTFIYSNGDKYDGDWLDELAHGTGTFTFANGDEYTGTWSYGEREGNGFYRHHDGEYFIGEWRDDKKNGQGTEWLPDGSEYQGEFFNGLKHGIGTFTYSTGESYVGTWDSGTKHGTGIFKYFDGSTYAGEWSKGEKHGLGTFQFADGDHLEAEWRHGTAYVIKSDSSSKSLSTIHKLLKLSEFSD